MLPSLLSGELPAVLQFLALSERDGSASLSMWHVRTLQDHHRVTGVSLRPVSHWRRPCGCPLVPAGWGRLIPVYSQSTSSSQPISWLILTNKTVQENTDKQTQYKSEKVDNLKYSKTKLPGFSCVLQHSARKRGGLILQRLRAHITGPPSWGTWPVGRERKCRQSRETVKMSTEQGTD